MTALYIKTSGSIQNIVPGNGSFFTLEELQKYVGGYIEFILTTDKRTMVVNEEGRLKNLVLNTEATKLAGNTDVVGDVIVCDWSMLQTKSHY